MVSKFTVFGSCTCRDVFYSGLNKNYVTEETGNKNATSIDDLKVKSPTVVKISDDKVVGYYEGRDEIISHFEAR